MKILISNNKIAGLALDSYSGPMEYMDAPESFDQSMIDHYEVINGELVISVESLKKLRQDAYRNESDPLFFKVQRQEASQAEWVAKIEEIRNRYPYPTEPE